MCKNKPFTNFPQCEWTARLESWRSRFTTSGMWRIVWRVLPDVSNHPLCPSSSTIAHTYIIQQTLSFHSAILLAPLDHEDESTTVIRNVGKYSPNDTASHPRSLESWARHILACILCKYRVFRFAQHIIFFFTLYWKCNVAYSCGPAWGCKHFISMLF
jgi:hypothetical protein